jgi:hypothetical protein
MLIKSVEVRGYRTLRHVKIDLTPGLNVIHGDNDTGKSTLMEAIRAGLVRPGRLTGKHLSSMCPRNGGHPEIDLCFELNGDEYEVHKKFGANGSTRLYRRRGGGVRTAVDGDPDEALTTLLRFGERRTPGGAIDLGILPLIWVKQGTSGRALSEVMNGEPGAALAERLAEIGGSPFDGAGTEPLAARVRAEYARHFTPGRGEPKAGSPLAVASDARKQAEDEVDDLRSRCAALEGLFVARERAERERRALAERVPALEKGLEAARAAQDKARSLLAQQGTASADNKLRQLEAKAARDQLARRRATHANISAARETLEGATRTAEEAAERVRLHDAGRAALVEHHGAAQTREHSAEQALRLARGQVELLQESQALDTLKRRLADAEAIDHALAKLHERLGELRIGQKELDRLSRLERDAENAAAELKARAVQVEIVAHQDVPVRIDAELSELRPEQRMRYQASERTVVRVGDLGEVIITPGGDDLATARETAQVTAATLRKALEKASVKSLVEARAAVDARRSVEGELAVTKAKLGVIAPAGVAAVREEHAAQRAKLMNARKALGTSGAGAPNVTSIDEARAASRAAERAHESARKAWEQAQAALTRHDALGAALLSARDVARVQAAGARHQLATLEQALAGSVASEGTDAALEEQARAAEVSAAEADRRRLALDEQVAAHDPKLAETRAEAAERACQRARDDSRRLEKEICGLDAQLDLAEGQDAAAALEEARERLALARASEGRRAEEAEGVRLMHETLRECREEAQTRYLAPLTREAHRLARLLDPTSKIALDAEHRVEVERAAFGAHRFESLGGGSKEQFATVIRLAMAGILAGDGVLPVLFDDAMVNTSDARFDRMADVLLDMASRLQLIVFTCHWERYAALGAHNAIDLQRARAQLEGRQALAA